MVALTGNPDGTSEVDYTVNSAPGFPWATGPRNLAEPLNTRDARLGRRHRDAGGRRPARRRAPPDPHRRGAAGPALALRRRLRDGRQPRPDRRGDPRRRATSPRTATTSTAPSATTSRPATAAGVMVVAITARQWAALLEATGIGEACHGVELATGHDLATETGRFEARDADRRRPAPLVRRARPRRGAGGLRRHRRLLGPLPDLPPAARRGPALLDRQPDVRAGRAPGRRHAT